MHKNLNLIFISFILVGIVLRLYDITEIPLMHDELSAWARTNFPNIKIVLREGVAGLDTHPALIQVFLYYYTSIFGDHTLVLKLPFVLMGIASLFLFYKIAEESFGRNNALVSLAVFAASEFIIIYSNLSRPYISGLFLSLLAVRFWLNLISKNDNSIKIYLLFGGSLALLAYNHYFSGLFAILLWLSTWIYFKKINIKYFLFATLLSCLLFLPHINITLHQLSKGGIGGDDGWLNPPDPYFIYDFFQFAFNYSNLAIAIILLLVIFRTPWNSISKKLKLRAVFCLWFLLSLGIGYAYSVYIDPVIQYSVLIFTFPFFLTGFLGELKGKFIHYSIFSVVIIGLLSYALIFERQHYEIMKKQPFERISSKILEFEDQGVNTFSYIRQNPKYLSYYYPQSEVKNPLINGFTSTITTTNVADSLLGSDAEFFYTDGSNEMLTAFGRIKYPNLVEREDGYTYTGYVFGKDGNGRIDEFAFASPDTTFSHEYYDLMTIDLLQAGLDFSDNISAIVSFGTSLPDEVLLVFSITRGEEVIHWSASNSSTESIVFQEKKWLVQQRCLWNNFRTLNEMENVELKIYLWNRPATPITLIDYKIEIIPGNPNFYSLLTRRPD